ncbi:MAG TPA: S9 family peptidase, partial [Chitinophagaceae bacterium]|nr:S9 family peptidase [Chitinophagaceae bacterium]
NKLVKKNLTGIITESWCSPTGKYIMWYDSKAKSYFVYDGDSLRNITSKIRVPLYDEEYDSPGDPSPYGVMGWHEGDSSVYIYDKYDIWKVNPAQSRAAYSLTANSGRKAKTSFRYPVLDLEKRFFTHADNLLLRTFSYVSKENWFANLSFLTSSTRQFDAGVSRHLIGQVSHARDVNGMYIYTKENFNSPPDLYVASVSARLSLTDPDTVLGFQLHEEKLSAINPQQKDYNWGTAVLYKWKTFQGKQSEGILYKPEDFNPAKQYPLILFFYERLSNGLHTYHPPSPTPSRLNISFFVSRGYLVFAPDIAYTIGHPAKSAYDFIVSAAKELAKHKWVDDG